VSVSIFVTTWNYGFVIVTEKLLFGQHKSRKNNLGNVKYAAVIKEILRTYTDSASDS